MQEGPERIDYQETPDVSEVHAAVKREHRDPRADVTPIPMWLTILSGVALVWAGLYMGIFHGGFRGDVFDENLSSPRQLFGDPGKKAGEAGPASQMSLADFGKGVYNGNCQSCHQNGGQGNPAMNIPPLAGSEWVKAEKRMVAILLKGLIGPVTVQGKTYNGAVMQAWEGSFNDKKLAGVATFVRTAWGNTFPEVSEAKIKAARAEFASRKTPWTEADLLQIPEDATLPDAGGGPAASAPAAGSAVASSTKAAETAPAISAPPSPPASAAAPSAAPASQTPAPVPGAASSAPASPAVLAQGKTLYMTICIACHQPTGMGLPPVFPPITKSEYVNGSAQRFAAMILKGNAGPMTIDGKLYNNIMPGQEAMLSDDKIAAVMTYVRANFGNAAPPVPIDVVKATRAKFMERKTPWTEAELKAWAD